MVNSGHLCHNRPNAGTTCLGHKRERFTAKVRSIFFIKGYRTDLFDLGLIYSEVFDMQNSGWFQYEGCGSVL